MQNPLSRRAALMASVLISPAWLTPGAALAQDAPATYYDLGEIVIYGDTAERTLQNTASSVTVVGEEEIADKSSAATVNEVIADTPNVFIPGTTSAPIIRGVDSDGPLVAGNAYLAKPLPRATMNIDGRYVSSVELSAGGGTTWDVDSIEVFRGPQTTSQGANAIAGAIVVNTKDPTFVPEYSAQLITGSRNKRRASLAASGPLSEDFAARISLDYTTRDTFVDYTNPGFTESGFDYDFSSFTGRAKLLWEPSDLPGLRVKLTYAHTDLHRPTNEQVTDRDDLENDLEYQDYMDVISDGVVLDAEYDFANGIRLSNQMQYSEADYDYEFAYPYSGTAGRDYETFSNELKLTFGQQEDIWSGVLGLYYSDEDTSADFANTYFGAPFGAADLAYRTRSAALFGEATWRFASDWSLTGGLRLQRDRIEIEGTTSYVTERLDYDETFTEVLPTLTLAHDFAEDWTVGATVSKGYLPGGAGTNFRGGTYYGFDPEIAWNSELFLRGSALDGALSLSGNLFYTEYQDIQRSVANCLDANCEVIQGSMIMNGERAHAYGFELSADYQASSTLMLSGDFGALQTEVTEFSDNDGTKYEGNEFARAPGYSVGLSAAWDITPDLTLRGGARYVDGYYSSDTNESDTEVDGYSLANMRLSYRPNANVEIFGYVDNVFDNRAELSASRSGAIEIAEPREFGVGVSMTF
ncbi:TonB-dependent receptor [Salipiger thiooxidans]|uniref:TonB-dependent receptor n=1 Tax=Salipiger thiooxidans TaxID=282683 RepID=UPI001CFA026A|nr:TonB-dependent receptor [Salipiger thiooxidans]